MFKVSVYTMQPPAYSDSRKEKGALITNNNKITSMETPNQINNKLLLLQWLNIFKQMYGCIRGSQRLSEVLEDFV